MTGIIKTDQLQGAQSSTIAVPSGNNLTVGGTLGVTGNQTNSGNLTVSGAFTSQGIDDNADAVAITINDSEQVGIGTSAMTSYYSKDLVVSCADQGGITLVGGTSDSQYLMFADGTSGADRYRGFVQYSHNANTMYFATNGSERMRIDASGYVGIGSAPDPSVKLTVNGSVGPTNGTASLPTHTFYSDPNTGIYRPGADNLGFAVGGQSKAFLSTTQFNITPSIVAQGGIKLGGNSYALEDYETGTWTPSIGGNASYSIQIGNYIKVGNLVHCTATVQINSIGTGSGNTLSGLPFTASNHGITAGAINVMYYSGIATALTWFSGYVRNNNNSIYFSGNNGVASTIQHNSQNVFQNGARVDFNVTYSSG